MPRYEKLPSQEKGMFRDTTNGHYYAVKHVHGKKHSKTFTDLKQARTWRDSKVSPKVVAMIDCDGEFNGVKPYTFKQAWEKYQLLEFPKLEKSTLEVKEERSKFFVDLMNVKMVYLTPDFVDDYILKKKKIIIESMKKNRYSLNSELVELRALCNFYRKVMDFKFVNPVIKDRHWPLGHIKDKPKVNKKMTEEEVNLFLESMWKLNEKNGLFALLAENQYLVAGRIQEPTAWTISKINFEEKEITIDRATSWHNRNKTFRAFKGTKTGKARFAHLTPRLERNLRILISRLPEGCDLIHQIDGRPLHYYEIQHAYDRGLKAAGLGSKYSATHFVRHSMAKQARRVTGSLDGAQAMGGWASVKQCEEYADSPSHMQIETVNKVEQRMRLVQ